MNETQHHDGVPEDYPGRITRFPEGVSHLVVITLGVQGQQAAERENFISHFVTLAQSGAHAAKHIERGECTDAAGEATQIILAYWDDVPTADNWWTSDAVSNVWRVLPADGDTGYFYERMTIPEARFNYAAGTEDRHGGAAVLPLEPCSTFGYWGAYRDRLPASKTDDFASPLEKVSVDLGKQTRGRRLSVTIPDNLCYIREGQGWGRCGPEELAVWNEQMNPVIDVWVERLGADPTATGCLSIRDCKEFDAAGSPNDRRTQIAFLVSLAHIEKAARTDPAHLAVHGAFVKMYRKPTFQPQMHVWVEIGVMKADEIETEYVNCHGGTGLLPYFEARAVN